MTEKLFDEILPTLPTLPEEDSIYSADYPSDNFPPLYDRIDQSSEVIGMPHDWGEDPEKASFPMDREESRAAEGGVQTEGIEVLAFYKSYRFKDRKPFIGQWGVFFINAGVHHLTNLICLDFPQLSNMARELAINFLWKHEVFHAKFDIGILGIEGAAKKHLYIPQKHAFRGCQTQQPEEALANKNAWDSVRNFEKRRLNSQDLSTQGITNFFFDFMKRQPGAYSRFDENEDSLKSETAAGIFEGHRYPRARCPGLAGWIGLAPPFSCTKSSIPQHLVLAVNYSRLISEARFTPRVAIINEANSFHNMLDPSHKKHWDSTKQKLIDAPHRVSLDFKKWPPKPPYWSVRINKGFRAHLNPISIKDGVWEAVEYGSHEKMGH